MKIVIITTGDEVIAGNVLDTNAAWLSNYCWKLGFKIIQRVTVSDDLEQIGSACLEASKKAEIVLVTGGLGPTVDDITLEAAAKAFRIPLLFHPKIDAGIRKFFKRIERPFSSSNRKQAYLPKGGKPIPNAIGTAPGCELQANKAIFFFLPGVPKELYPMFEKSVFPKLQKMARGQFFEEKILKCFGLPEASFDEKLKNLGLGPVRLSFRVYFPEVWLKLACWGKNKEEVQRALKRVTKSVYQKLRNYIFGEGDATLEKVVGDLLKKNRATLSIAESCTGGLLADSITNVSGASKYFERGVVVYSNVSKNDLLGVREKTLKKFGAVSPEVAKEMADGIRKKAGTTYGLAVTGVAGPTGGTKKKPVGTIYIALATPKKVLVKHFCFARERREFKLLVKNTALDGLRRELQ